MTDLSVCFKFKNAKNRNLQVLNRRMNGFLIVSVERINVTSSDFINLTGDILV